MFEGKPLLAAEPQISAMGEALGAPATGLQWSDLVAKLDAARDLRAALNLADPSQLASFDAGLAQRLCAQEASAWGNDERAVNLEDSANGKGNGGMEQAGIFAADPATRG